MSCPLSWVDKLPPRSSEETLVNTKKKLITKQLKQEKIVKS